MGRKSSLSYKDKINVYKITYKHYDNVIYIGQTSCIDLIYYLKSKFWKLNEVLRGKRRTSKFFNFLKDKTYKDFNIELLVQVNNRNESDFYEKKYIKFYSDNGFNVLNYSEGGYGGNMYKNKTDEEMKDIGLKISNKLSGIKRSKETINAMSYSKLGEKNPASKRIDVDMYVNGEFILKFNYRFEMVRYFYGEKQKYDNLFYIFKKLKEDGRYLFRKKYLLVYNKVI